LETGIEELDQYCPWERGRSVKALIVEDDSAKLQLVANVLRQSVSGEIEIETANDVGQAKRLLTKDQFDIAVLDISLPIMSGEDSTPLAGLELMEEVSRRPKYKKPGHIVGLTGYPAQYADSLPRFNNEMWSLIFFDRTSEEWSDQLSRKVRYIEVSLKASNIPTHRSDLCVIAALQDPELKALLNLPWDWRELSADGDATLYHEGRYVGMHGERRVIAAHAPQMGMVATAILATKMIHCFAPKYLVMIGICAGIRGVCNLGDIVCADPCWDWGSGKLIDRAGASSFLQAPSQLRLDSFIRAKLAAMCGDQALWDRVKREWSFGNSPSHGLKMHIGPLASGATVLSDMSTAGNVKDQHRQLAGIDMEAYSIFAAAAESVLPQPKAFVLKSVVDFADPEKSDNYRDYAAFTGAKALEEFAKRYI
jgi:nucleoside phosphorylase/CheY-like chemotaxis protein